MLDCKTPSPPKLEGTKKEKEVITYTISELMSTREMLKFRSMANKQNNMLTIEIT
jgi:hypothetical protein